MVKRIAFFLILIISLVLRLLASYPGYPPYHPDEGITYSAATSMLKNRNLDPLRYDYPSLSPLINLYFYKSIFIPLAWTKFFIEKIPSAIDGYVHFPLSPIEYRQYYQNDILGSREVNALTWSRIITAMLSVGSVYLVYRIGKFLFSEETGLISSILLAFNYRAELNGVLGLPDTYNAFFLLLSFLSNLYLLRYKSRGTYLLAGICAGLSLSVKFQPFGLGMFLVTHILIANTRLKAVDKAKDLFNVSFLSGLLLSVLVFLIINPYFFIHIEEANQWLSSVAGKYRLHRYQLDFYPISYLYHYGIGKLTFVLTLVGAILLIKNKLRLILLASVIFPFFYVTIYYSGAGFYTRNFVTVTPFLLILCGYAISSLSFSIKKPLIALSVIALTVLVLWENVLPTLAVATEYRKQWNYITLGDWVTNNLPEGSVIAAHSSVPLPLKDVVRSSFDFQLDFSLSEFRKAGDQYAITNFDWSTNDFYWWMAQDSYSSLLYWNKPITLLSESYPAKALRELSDYAIYSVFKDQYAPESNFMVSVIPKVSSNKIDLIKEYNFLKGEEGWLKRGSSSDSNLISDSRGLVITKNPQRSLSDRWESPILRIDEDIIVDGQLLTESSQNKDGFIYVKLYKSCNQKYIDGSYDSIRVSERNVVGKAKITLEIKKRENISCAIVGFQSYSPQNGQVVLSSLKIWSGKVTENLGKWRYNPENVPDAIMFPNSHGNL